MIKSTPFFLLLSILCLSCSRLTIIDLPISFDEERKQLSLEYLEQRYELVQETPAIVPKMVVVHYTVVPTWEKTYHVFFGPKLPGSRTALKGASQLNVSSQYLVDRDGTIYQLLPDTVFARHTIGLNHSAIGIENVADGDQLPMTDEQLKANAHLIRHLAQKHPIEYVIGHHEYQRFRNHPLWLETDANYLTEKSDPGDAFMGRLRKKLANLNLKGPPGK
jgi:N-acetyl-anhydromuramyl-L-alanine amidase AmpD